MGLRKYNGKLGQFEYDCSQFKIVKESKSNTEYLKYIGKVNDGTKIMIPNGIVDCYRMFDGSSIYSMPDIPVSVRYAAKMFRKCSNLSAVKIIPKTIKGYRDMFSGCKKSVQNDAQRILDMSGRGCDTLMENVRQGENEAFDV